MTRPGSREPAVPSAIVDLADRARGAGARLLLVGGCVRDGWLGREPRDWDLEIYGLDPLSAEALLAEAGFEHSGWVDRRVPLLFARAPGVPAVEVAVVAEVDRGGLDAAFAEQARGRDLTINAMARDPLTGEHFDPYRGREDLAARRLQAVEPSRFGEDPLRALRVARLAATLEATPDPGLVALCGEQDLTAVAGERIFAEFDFLLAAPRPSLGLRLLAQSGSLGCVPELAALVDVPQDPRWHPEGCVWTHTLMVVDEAAGLRSGETERDSWLLWSALLHDLGKPETTTTASDGAIRSHGHDVRGAECAAGLLTRLRASARRVSAVQTLVRYHLAPALFIGQGAGDRAFRRLARKLSAGGVDAVLLQRLARADHFGRTTQDALARRFEAGDAFLAQMEQLAVAKTEPPARVHGSDVLARGVLPGPEVGAILERCEEVADETGWTDAEQILDRVLDGR